MVYVVFSLGEELERALEMCASGEVVRCDVGSMGLSRWCEEYASSRPTPAELDSAVRKVLGKFQCNLMGPLYNMLLQVIMMRAQQNSNWQERGCLSQTVRGG